MSNQPASTRELIRLLGDAMPGAKIETAELDEATQSPLEDVVRQVGEGEGGPVMVVGLEKACPSTAPEQPVLRALNLSRPEWLQRLPRPVVLWVPEYVLELLAREAPDFLDWRSDTVVFAEPTADELRPLDSRLWGGAARMSMPLVERQERITELRSRLAGLPEDMDQVAREARQDWLLELADHLMLLGETEAAEEALREGEVQLAEWEKGEAQQLQSARLAGRRGRLLKRRGEVEAAANAFEKARVRFGELEKEGERATATYELARLKARTGAMEEALPLLQQALSVFKRLGDERSRAVALGDLAYFRAQAGKVGEALRLHQERLEIFERLGAVRERAITLVDLARLRAAAGDTGKAERLLQEVLSDYERLGDVRSRAVTLGDLAKLKAQDGETSEARALDEERLEVNRKLGDLDGIANAQFDLATLDLDEGAVEAAAPRLSEAWTLVRKISHINAVATVGVVWGQVLVAQGQTAAALEVLSKAEAAFRRLGRTEQADEVAERVADLEGSVDPEH